MRANAAEKLGERVDILIRDQVGRGEAVGISGFIVSVSGYFVL